MTTWRILTGDCIEQMRTLPDASVQCCVTSPPYWGLRDYGHAGQIGLEETPEAYVARMVEVFREVRRVLRDDGTLWLNLGDSYAASRGWTTPPAQTVAGGVGGKGGQKERRGQADGYNPTRDCTRYGLKHKDLVGIPWRVAFALQADGWWLRQDIIWHKPNPMPESVTDRCTKAHEYVFLMAKGERYLYDARSIAEDAKHAGVVVRASNPKTAKNAGKGQYGATALGFTQHDTVVGDKRNRRSVWSITTKPYRGAHFAVMPEALVEPCVLAGSQEGSLVLDPFTGSGTVGAVAMRLGRQFVGCELNPEYVKLAEQRISEAQAAQGLFGSTPPPSPRSGPTTA